MSLLAACHPTDTIVVKSVSLSAAYPKACQALVSMIPRKALNPADITVVSLWVCQQPTPGHAKPLYL